MTLDLRFERVLPAPPERVFDAFTDPEGQLEFYGDDAPGWVVDSRCELRVGGVWSVSFGPSRDRLYHHRHVFEALDRPDRIRLATTETRLDGSSFETTMEFTFEPRDGGTLMSWSTAASRPRRCATSTRAASRTPSTASRARPRGDHVQAVLYMSMSLDGFITGPDDGPAQGLGAGGERLHDWLADGGDDPAGYRPAGPSGAIFDEVLATGSVLSAAARSTSPAAGAATTTTASRSSSRRGASRRSRCGTGCTM